MKLKSMLLAVRDLQASVAFYKEVFGLRVVADFGANVTLTGGLSLQTLDTWEAFIGKKQVVFGGNDAEVYFEEDDFDAFLKKLEGAEVRYVHPPLEQSWGQRTRRACFGDRGKYARRLPPLCTTGDERGADRRPHGHSSKRRARAAALKNSCRSENGAVFFT